MTKKLLSILIAVFAANFILNYTLVSLIPESDFSLYYILKIILKLVFVFLSIFFIKTLTLDFKLYKNSIYIIPISTLLIFLSFQNIEQTINSSNVNITTNQNILFFISCLCVGAFEELFLRVYVFQSILTNLKRKSLVKAISITSLIFGLAHITNMLKPDVVALSILLQIVMAFGLGFVFQAIYLRVKNILLPICLHGILNYFGTYKSQLLNPVTEEITEFDINSFIVSLGFVLAFTIILITISYFLIQPILVKNKEEKNTCCNTRYIP